MEKLDEQNITVADYSTMTKIIEAALQRGIIRANEASTVGKLYEKIQFQMKKQNKENENAGLSETNN